MDFPLTTLFDTLYKYCQVIQVMQGIVGIVYEFIATTFSILYDLKKSKKITSELSEVT